MKATGIVRPLDCLGRIVIPKEIRKTFDLNEKDEIEIFVEDDMIMLKKYEPSCIFCGADENLISYKGKTICSKCLNQMNLISKEKN